MLCVSGYTLNKTTSEKLVNLDMASETYCSNSCAEKGYPIMLYGATKNDEG